MEAEREKDSSKPEVIRGLIEKVSPPPRLELLARRVMPGWTCWGNQIKVGGNEPAKNKVARNPRL